MYNTKKKTWGTWCSRTNSLLFTFLFKCFVCFFTLFVLHFVVLYLFKMFCFHFVPPLEREFNPDVHCGVLDIGARKPCTRSLTCKVSTHTHSHAQHLSVQFQTYSYIVKHYDWQLNQTLPLYLHITSQSLPAWRLQNFSILSLMDTSCYFIKAM